MTASRLCKSLLRMWLGMLLLILGLYQCFIIQASFQNSSMPMLDGILDEGSLLMMKNQSEAINDSSDPTEIYTSKQLDDSKDHTMFNSSMNAEPIDERFVKRQHLANATAEAGKVLNVKQLNTSSMDQTRQKEFRNPSRTTNITTEPQDIFEPRRFDWNQTFSTCLIFMDDHHLLSEWLAYHYFALPLGYLVIAVDPASKDPPHIDDYWHTVMTIELWNDKDFMQFPGQVRRMKKDGTKELEYKYVRRQREFYKVCGKYLRDKGRTLTSFHDTDEYITVSNQFQANFSQTIVHQPGFVWNLLQMYRQQERQAQQQQQRENTTTTTTTNTTNSLSKIHKYYSNTCFHTPRALYSAVESTAAERNHSLPTWMDARQFETLRYRYRLTPTQSRGPNKARNGLAKVIVDVSRLTDADLVTRSTPHAPFKPLCLRTSPSLDYGTVPVGIHHYLGPWEFYYRDNDPRKETVRTRANWEMLAQGKAGADDEIRPWIRGFLDLVGTEQAKYLLRNAGLSLKNQTK